MQNDEILEMYFKELKKSFYEKSLRFHSIIRKPKNDSSPESFNTIYLGLSLFLNISDAQIEKSITDGINDYSIDAIYIPNNDSIFKNITIFDFKGNSSLNYEDIKKFIEYVEKYILDGNDLPREGNKELLERLKELHKYINENPNTKIDIVIYREDLNNTKITKNEENRLQYLKSKFDKIGEVKVLGNKEVLNLVARKLWYEGNIYANNFNNFNLNYDKGEIINIDKNIIIGTVNLFNLLNFLNNIEIYNSSCNTDNRKYDIFRLNVRKQSKKSEPIRESIIKTVEKSPEKFLSYNNGITITCENFNINELFINFEQPQIVNGCQTISGLYDNFKNSIIEYINILNGNECNYRNKEEVIKCISNIEKLKKAKIYVKIVIAEQLSNEPKNISHYANSQTVVTYGNLVSNNLEQLIISNYLRLNGFNYFRKEGQDFEKGKNIISMLQVYKIMYSYILLDPSRGKNDLKNIFEEDIYNKLFPGIFTITDIIKISSLFKQVSEYIKRSNINKYYLDYIIFGLFLLYKENNLDNIKPSTLKTILDTLLEVRIGKKTQDFESYDLMRYLQRSSIFSDDLVKKLEEKYNFILDKGKFSEFTNLFRKKIIEDRKEKMKNKIYFKSYNLEKLINYLEEKDENGKQFKNLIWIIIDIISENNGKINREDLFIIINKFKKYDLDYFNNRLDENSSKIIEKDKLLYINKL